MLKPGQVPKEVIVELLDALNGCDCDECVSVAIAAALNAWPGMEIEMIGESDNFLILPLPQKDTDE